MNPDLPPVNGPRGYRPKNIFDSPNLPVNQPSPVSPMPDTQPPRSHKKLILIISAIVIIVLIVAAVVATTIGKNQVKQESNANSSQNDNPSAQNMATNFVKDIIGQNYDQAWAKTSQPFQKTVNRDKFNNLVKPLAQYVGTSATQSITDQQQSNSVTISGAPKGIQGVSYVFEIKNNDQVSVEYLRLNVASFDGKWQVYSLVYQPTALKADVSSSGQYFVSQKAK
jgi:hypothetical protein